MLTLIAESKTMTPCDLPVEATAGDASRPVFADRAGEIMADLARMPADELAARTRLSPALLTRLRGMARDFAYTATGQRSIEAFTGVVFKAFDYATLDGAARAFTAGHVAIVSSLYGWLRPDDIVKAYRLDFTAHAAPGGRTMAAYWRREVTGRLLDAIDRGGHKAVINLLPGDAARCIDWQAVSRVARVYKVDFREITDGGASRTPQAVRLKTLRGRLLRHIAVTGTDSPEALAATETDDRMPHPAAADGTITFLTAPPA